MRLHAPARRRRGSRRRGGDIGNILAAKDPRRLRHLLVLMAVTVAWPSGIKLAHAACTGGLEGIENDGVCCVAACGLCGGTGCGSVEGLENVDCCSNVIKDSNVFCGDVNVAPCILSATPTPSPADADVTPAPANSPIAPSAPAAPTVSAPTLNPSTNPNAPTAAAESPAQPTLPPTEENVTPAPVARAITSAPFAPSTCSNGIPGVQSSDVCCMERCGICGGSGCGALGSNDCCLVNIRSSGIICGVSGAVAPCVIEETIAPTPTPLAPGETLSPTPAPVPTPSPTSPPPEALSEAPVLFTNSPSAPDPATDSPVGTDVPVGSGGGERGVTDPPVGAGGDGDTMPPIGFGTPAPTATTEAPVGEEVLCTNDTPGFQHGVVCCPISCGQCGGSGCENIPGTEGGSDCCSDIILASGLMCNSTVDAPCIVGTADEVSIANEADNAAMPGVTAATAIYAACAAIVVAAWARLEL